MTDIVPQPFQFPSANGRQLHGTWFLPEDSSAADAVVVICGATGVPEGLYSHFAKWVAAQRGLPVLTFTYSDMQDVSARAMRASQITMQDWAIDDCQAARDAAQARFADLPIWVVGHSLGGMMLPKQPRVTGVTRVTTVASGVVTVNRHPMPFRLVAWFFWYVLGPLAIKLTGFLSGKAFGFGSNLPATVFFQWRAWCAPDPGFYGVIDLPKSDWSRSAAPVRLIAFQDDAICPAVAAFDLETAYEGATDIEKISIDPKAFGLQKIGHMGAFSRKNSKLWPLLLDADFEQVRG